MQSETVKVAVRVRPLFQIEKLESEDCITYVEEKRLLFGSNRPFSFDFCFGPDTKQIDVYNRCGEPLVQSLFSLNGTIFALASSFRSFSHTLFVCLSALSYGQTVCLVFLLLFSLHS